MEGIEKTKVHHYVLVILGSNDALPSNRKLASIHSNECFKMSFKENFMLESL